MQSVTYPDGSGESWDEAAGYRAWDATGATVRQRDLTVDEITTMANHEAAPVREANTATLKDQARNALATNDTFLDLPTPSFPLTVAAQTALVNQVRALTRQNAALIRLVLAGDLLDAVQP